MTPDEPIDGDGRSYCRVMRLILSERPDDIKEHEQLAGMTQPQAIDWLFKYQEDRDELLVEDRPATAEHCLTAIRCAWYGQYREEYLWMLVFSDDEEKVAHLAKNLGTTQSEAVDYFVEVRCSKGVPHLGGHKGSAAERRVALRHFWETEMEPYGWPEDPMVTIARLFRE